MQLLIFYESSKSKQLENFDFYLLNLPFALANHLKFTDFDLKLNTFETGAVQPEPLSSLVK